MTLYRYIREDEGQAVSNFRYIGWSNFKIETGKIYSVIALFHTKNIIEANGIIWTEIMVVADRVGCKRNENKENIKNCTGLDDCEKQDNKRHLEADRFSRGGITERKRIKIMQERTHRVKYRGYNVI